MGYRVFLRPQNIVIFMLGLVVYISIKTISVFIGEDHTPLLITAPPAVKSTTSWWKVPNPTVPNVSYCDSDLAIIPPSLRESDCSMCKTTTCHKLLFSNSADYFYKFIAKDYTTRVPRKGLTDNEVGQRAQNCATFIKESGYHTDPVPGEDVNYPIAYNILMHTGAEQVERMLRAIYRPQNVYCIHVDAKSPDSLHKTMQQIAGCLKNVFLASKLERVVYAGFSRLQADLNCMQDMLKHPVQWKYLINTAGQAYPLRTNQELIEIFKIYNGSNDIEGIWGKAVRRTRFDVEWIEVDKDQANPRMAKTGSNNPPPPDEIDIVRGSAYGIFSRQFVQFILTDEKSQHLLEWSKRTYSPDEHFWATLHHTYSNPHIKSPGSFSGYPSEKPWLAAYSAWGGRDECNGQWRHGSCVFGLADLPLLMERREHFANKFSLDVQPATFECLEAWIRHKVHCPTEFDEKYYKKLPFINRG